MLSLKNTQKLLFWQHEVIVSFSCRSAPAHRANKAERTSCSSQPEMHFREAFARAFSNKRNTRETNVITIFSNTKLRVINTYSWLKKNIQGLASQCLSEHTMNTEIAELPPATRQKQKCFFGAAGARGSTVGSSWLGSGRVMPQKPNASHVWERNKNLHWSRQQVLIQRLALTTQTRAPFYNFNLFYLLMQLISLKRLAV